MPSSRWSGVFLAVVPCNGVCQNQSKLKRVHASHLGISRPRTWRNWITWQSCQWLSMSESQLHWCSQVSMNLVAQQAKLIDILLCFAMADPAQDFASMQRCLCYFCFFYNFQWRQLWKTSVAIEYACWMMHLKSFFSKSYHHRKAEFMNGLVQHLAIRLVRLVRHVTEDARKDEELRELNRRFEEWHLTAAWPHDDLIYLRGWDLIHSSPVRLH